MTLVLIGPPAAGKSRIGTRVARLLGEPFLDTDSLIVGENGPIPEIFARHGEPHFRSLEREQVVAALAAGGVVSFGGGTVLDPDTRHDLEGLPVVLLTVQPHAVLGRLGSGKRPLVPDIESWIAVFEARRDLYDRLAGFTVDTSDRPADTIAEEIARWARSRRAESKESIR